MTDAPRRSMKETLRRRVLPQLLFFLVLWPILSIAAGTMIVGEQPFTSNLPVRFALAGVTAGAANIIPELIALGLLAALTGIVLFGIADAIFRGPDVRGMRWLEPFVMIVAIGVGFALEYPALLTHPLFLLMRALPVKAAFIVMPLLTLLPGLIGRSPRRFFAHALPVIAMVLLAWAMALAPRPSHNRTAPRDSVFLLGFDSLSQADTLPLMRQMVAQSNGAWYDNPVTPGLLTNSVWTAIVQHRTVRETGVFLTYQSADWKRSPYQLIAEAERRGFETWSFFSDQFTTYIGSIAGFDVNRSGPKGWLQVATATMKEAHLLGPVLLPRMPRVPFARTPANQSGTFAFHLPTEMRDFFTAGTRDEKIFAAAHLDYLHQSAYPSMSELTRDERTRVLAAPVDAIRDLSLHWQYPELEGEPLGIYRWKIVRLQRVTNDVLRETGAADPAKRNRIVIFSDHGNRKGVGLRNFARRRYYKVLLATIGIPSGDTRAPIAILDIPLLLNWPDPSRPGPAPLVVEYTNATDDAEWQKMVKTSKLSPDGEITLDPTVTSSLGQRLLAYWPHRGTQAYFPAPSVPTEVTARP
ncbi:MAG TPA: hypothetical protein VF846_08595 [Thermoanaerobaculia bacterium]